MRKERLVALSFMAVSLGLVASIGLSVAWYANGAYLRISDVDLTLMSEPELGIGLKESSDPNDYYFGTIPTDKLPEMKSGYSDTYVEGTKSEINGFAPVSSMYSGDWIGKMDSEGNPLNPRFCTNYRRPTIYDETTFKKTAEAVSGFYSVPLFLYCDRDMYVSIDESTTFVPDHERNVVVAKELAKEEDETRTPEEIVGDLDNIVKSLRFSIYDLETQKYWIVDPYKGEDETYLSGVLDLDNNHLFDFYYDGEDKAYKEYLFGEYDDTKDIIYRSVKDNTEPERFDTFNAKHAEQANEIDIEACIDGGILKKEDSHTPEHLNGMDMIPLMNRVPHKIVLSIYIEGWDRDNTPRSSLGAFNASIKFKLTKPNFSN